MIIPEHLSVGHYTDKEGKTGLTVFLLNKYAPCAYFISGSAPASRELAILDHGINVYIDGLIFSGGSAFGLGAANGVMHWQQEQGKGFPTRTNRIPIIPMACIYDLGSKNQKYPTAEHAYMACKAASSSFIPYGRVGVGTGATVGKLSRATSPIPGGFGYVSKTYPNGLIVSVFVVVNCVGNVINQNGKIIAGAVDQQGKCIPFDPCKSLNEKVETNNTTLVAIFTNAILNKYELTSVAKMSSAGLARAIVPAFAPFDGDIIFSVSTGLISSCPLTVGAIAANALQQAVIYAVSDCMTMDVR